MSTPWQPIDCPGEPVGQLLRAQGNQLVTANGRPVHLTGVNWFGMETGAFAPHGLWARKWQDMLDQIVASGFNMLRIPFNNQMLDLSSRPKSINYNLNPDLEGLSPLQILDTLVTGAGVRGLKIVLDRHRPTTTGVTSLWYTDDIPEGRWIQDWVTLAQRYLGNDTIIGADLHNEPHEGTTWGDGNLATDWRLAAERAGNAILAANPEWLIFVQGIGAQGGEQSWWGGNLINAGQFPVRLIRPDKLVYSPHDYGPSVSWQPWFSDSHFPANLPSVWRHHWAYLHEEGIAPLWMGEFGGQSLGQDVEGTWMRSLLNYLAARDIGYAYWAWNADCGDTGGILTGDWHTIDLPRLHLLEAYQAPFIHLAARPSEGRDG
jgi:aryl-phospho-beta-D-glucosidase BglC (GH1 family)